MHFRNDREETGCFVAVITQRGPLSNYSSKKVQHLYLFTQHSTGLNETKQECGAKPGGFSQIKRLFVAKARIRNVLFTGCS